MEPATYLTVIVPSELASGFRIAGADVKESRDADAAAGILEAMIRGGDRGVVGVYSRYYAALDPALQERSERSLAPVVVPLPSGLEADEGVSQRARVAALLERAVGYHITFGDEER
ncbi:MAG: V-type ATP synthase subunit F [Acidimicrobiia bacterium]|nr:V-type ATP synthase subunit F [Acidimicrobiia bacterium]